MEQTENLTKSPTYNYRIIPRYGVYSEDGKVILQISLPGVHREDISIKALKDYVSLRAPRGDTLYYLDLDLGVAIEPEKTTTNYAEGLLRAEFQRYNPLDHAYEVKIE